MSGHHDSQMANDTERLLDDVAARIPDGFRNQAVGVCRLIRRGPSWALYASFPGSSTGSYSAAISVRSVTCSTTSTCSWYLTYQFLGSGRLRATQGR